jgi:hypothetical protein
VRKYRGEQLSQKEGQGRRRAGGGGTTHACGRASLAVWAASHDPARGSSENGPKVVVAWNSGDVHEGRRHSDGRTTANLRWGIEEKDKREFQQTI